MCAPDQSEFDWRFWRTPWTCQIDGGLAAILLWQLMLVFCFDLLVFYFLFSLCSFVYTLFYSLFTPDSLAKTPLSCSGNSLTELILCDLFAMWSTKRIPFVGSLLFCLLLRESQDDFYGRSERRCTYLNFINLATLSRWPGHRPWIVWTKSCDTTNAYRLARLVCLLCLAALLCLAIR